jgi:hypothetical protein
MPFEKCEEAEHHLKRQVCSLAGFDPADGVLGDAEFSGKLALSDAEFEAEDFETAAEPYPA